MIRLLMAALTCYRLSKLVSEDDGPFFIFKRLRTWANDKAYQEALANGVNPTNEIALDRWFGNWHSLAKGLCCPYCTGIWFSVPLFLLVKFPTKLGDMFLKLMSISGIQAFLLSLGK